jgi:chitin disaccharide deacetylase
MKVALGRALKRAEDSGYVGRMATPRSGTLIINADDFGLDVDVTDRILECFRAGTISSTTALVWMADSDRAAALSSRETLPIGLHLNLIEPFTAPDVPDAVATTQRGVVERLSSGGIRAQMYHPGWSREFERSIGDQLSRFQELYGRMPTHIDGHRHMHLALNVLFARALGPVKRCRRPLALSIPESPASKRAVRALVHRLIQLRFTTTDWFFSIRALHPELGGSGIDEKLGLASLDSVEVMVHPGVQDELGVLRSTEWRAHLERYRLQSFEDLS